MLASGRRLAHYEIVGALGAGGMGEVYRAADTKLKREVAIKVLPPQFASDPARLARFEREAQALAALNHPNIAAIYGLEHVDDVRFLVLELVEGQTIAERLVQKRMEVAEALRIATQIAEAIEAAHEKGIVHRDLKPANVKLTPDGKVKVLDFGLAKALGDPAPPADPANSPTITMGETRAGVVLGTAAYMSPEQASGKAVDKRTDVWSFGVLLYEMLTGKKAFEGKTVSHIIVHVMEQDPEWSALPPIPAEVRSLIERCLQKDPAQRLRDIGDLRLQLQFAITRPVVVQVAAAPASRSRLPLRAGIAAAAVIVTAGASYLYLRPKAETAPATVGRFQIAAPEQSQGLNPAQSSVVRISPDGKHIVFFGPGDSGSRLWIRRLDSLEAKPLEGTEGASGIPFWSSDSRFIAFSSFGDGKLKKVEVTGGRPQVLADSGVVRGGFWTSDGRIVFSGADRDLAPTLRYIPGSGGTAKLIRGVVQQDSITGNPVALPGGRHLLYGRNVLGASGPDGVYIAPVDLQAGEVTIAQNGAKRLLAATDAAVFAPTPDPARGYLLFIRKAALTDPEGILMAQPFDMRNLELAGEPVPVAERVADGAFSPSDNGVLIYRAGAVGNGGSQLTWYDRKGKLLGTTGEPGSYQSMSFSPDGTRIAAERRDPQSQNVDLWMFDLKRDVSQRFTFDNGTERFPVWSPDGSRIVYALNPGGDLYQKLSNGGGEQELLYKSAEPKVAVGWTGDGRYLMFSWGPPSRASFVLPLEGGKGTPLKAGEPYRFQDKVTGGRFSPAAEGATRFVAYPSDESGKFEVYVRPFDPKAPNGAPPGAGKWMVSRGGGSSPHWRADGKELLYLARDGTVMAVDVTLGKVFEFGEPKPLFKFPGPPISAVQPYWDVTPDGQRFLRAVPLAANSAAPFTVVLNWTSTLKR